MQFHLFSFVCNFFRFFRLFYRPIKVAPKVSDHFCATRVTLWTKLSYHIAFYTFNFLKIIFIFKPYVYLLWLS
jgi:hypothetical protein